jgi:2-amino-4-hydroxy-6-hydroxymethyldihydropteridine diphosphokinase
VTLAYVGIGSNLGEPAKQVESALEELGRIRHTSLAARSSVYRSQPVGYADQLEFFNAVAALETSLEPLQLLRELQAIEARHGRRRSFPNAPRTLDLDLLLHGQAVVRRRELTVPHPRMHQRGFVLKPLLEIAPEVEIPGIGAARARLDACADQFVEKIIG